jgi:hypothetical protein
MTRIERRKRKEEKLLAVFVSGRRIGMCRGGLAVLECRFFLA